MVIVVVSQAAFCVVVVLLLVASCCLLLWWRNWSAETTSISVTAGFLSKVLLVTPFVLWNTFLDPVICESISCAAAQSPVSMIVLFVKLI